MRHPQLLSTQQTYIGEAEVVPIILQQIHLVVELK